METQKTEEKKELQVFTLDEAATRQFAADYVNLIVTNDNVKQANKARLALKNKRLDIKAIADANEDILKGMVKQNKETFEKLVAIIKPTEDRIAADVKKIEDEEARLKLVEENRKKAIEANIAGMSQRIVKVMGMTSMGDLEAMSRQVQDFIADYNPQEYKPQFDEAVLALTNAINMKRTQLAIEAKQKLEEAEAKAAELASRSQHQESLPPNKTYTPQSASNSAIEVTKERFLGATMTEPEDVTGAEQLMAEAKNGDHALGIMVNFTYASYRFHIDSNLPTDTQEKIKTLIQSEVDNLEF
jgi:hypothetical protein